MFRSQKRLRRGCVCVRKGGFCFSWGIPLSMLGSGEEEGEEGTEKRRHSIVWFNRGAGQCMAKPSNF